MAPKAADADATAPMPVKPSPSIDTKQSAFSYAAELPLPEDLQAVLGEGYVVESFLGQGGMGAVYKGSQMPLRRPVAIKILAKRQPGEEDDFAFEERFKREAYAMATLTHPHIVQVYDCGDAGEHHLFISMELVEGGDLSDAIKSGACTPEAALKLHPADLRRACRPRTSAGWCIGISNRRTSSSPRTAARRWRTSGWRSSSTPQSTFVTKIGMGMGTPDYAAPEQYDAVPDLDHRADIYALGVMMYQMLTGRLPRGANYKTPSQLVGVDARIDDMVAKAMANEREERYQSAAQVAADLAAIAGPAPRTVPTPTRAVLTKATPTPRTASTGVRTPAPAGRSAAARQATVPPKKKRRRRRHHRLPRHARCARRWRVADAEAEIAASCQSHALPLSESLCLRVFTPRPMAAVPDRRRMEGTQAGQA